MLGGTAARVSSSVHSSLRVEYSSEWSDEDMAVARM
jgi:hypothetical protein